MHFLLRANLQQAGRCLDLVELHWHQQVDLHIYVFHICHGARSYVVLAMTIAIVSIVSESEGRH